MLPGFRFLFAATVLSVSILVFGVGAAALLRAAHEEFAVNPSWRAGPQEPVLARNAETREAVLAALRVEPQIAPPNPSETPPTEPEAAAAPVAAPASDTEQPPPKPEAATPPTTEPVETATASPSRQPDESASESAPKTEPAASEPAPQDAVAPAAAESAPAEADVTASTDVPAGDAKPAAAEPAVTEPTANEAAANDKVAASEEAAAPPPSEPAPAAPEPVVENSASSTDSAAPAAVAANDPGIAVNTAASAKPDAATQASVPAKVAGGTPDKPVVKKHTHRARKRRRIVQRPPAQVAVQQQPFDPFVPGPFAQPQTQPTPATTTRPRR